MPMEQLSDRSGVTDPKQLETALAQRVARRLDGRGAAKSVRPRGTRCAVGLKRAYEPSAPSDGMRVLVDRLWPRGLSKQRLAVNFWLKDVAPSHTLRRWYAHDPRRWESFRTKYRAELARRTDPLRLLDELRRRGRVTLLYGARDTARNHAVVLREVLEERRCAARRGAPKAAAVPAADLTDRQRRSS